MHQSVIAERNLKNKNILIFLLKFPIIALHVHKTKHLNFVYFLLLYVIKEDHVCQSTYSIVSRSTYMVNRDMYVNQDTVCRSAVVPNC